MNIVVPVIRCCRCRPASLPCPSCEADARTATYLARIRIKSNRAFENTSIKLRADA